MRLAKSGQIKNVCLPNALMTLCEYAADYGDDSFRENTERMVNSEIPKIMNEKIRGKTQENVSRIINNGERDFFV